MEDEDIMSFNILFLGNQDVGKTSYIIRFCDDIFNDKSISTIGVDIKTKEVNRKDKKILLKIFDTAGQERFRSISKNYFLQADGILLLYDISNLKSFESIKGWIENIKENINLSEIGIVIIGNKCELPDDEKVISNLMREDLEKNLNIKIVEASAKSNKNVQESFMMIIDKILEIKLGIQSDKNHEDYRSNSIKLESFSQKKEKNKHKHQCFFNKIIKN